MVEQFTLKARLFIDQADIDALHSRLNQVFSDFSLDNLIDEEKIKRISDRLTEAGESIKQSLESIDVEGISQDFQRSMSAFEIVDNERLNEIRNTLIEAGNAVKTTIEDVDVDYLAYQIRQRFEDIKIIDESQVAEVIENLESVQVNLEGFERIEILDESQIDRIVERLNEVADRINDAFENADVSNISSGIKESFENAKIPDVSGSVDISEESRNNLVDTVDQFSYILDNFKGGFGSQLRNIIGGMGGGGEGGGGSPIFGGGAAGGGAAGGAMGSLGALAAPIMAIAGGIFIVEKIHDVASKIFQVLVDSSEVLQGAMELLSTSFKLLIKPLADFLGFILMPIMVMLMKYLLIPFYREMLPKVKDFADEIEQTIAPLLKEISPYIKDILVSFNTGMLSLGKDVIINLVKWVIEVYEWLKKIWNWFDESGLKSFTSDMLDETAKFASDVGSLLQYGNEIKNALDPAIFAIYKILEVIYNSALKPMLMLMSKFLPSGEEANTLMDAFLRANPFTSPAKLFADFAKILGREEGKSESGSEYKSGIPRDMTPRAWEMMLDGSGSVSQRARLVGSEEVKQTVNISNNIEIGNVSSDVDIDELSSMVDRKIAQSLRSRGAFS